MKTQQTTISEVSLIYRSKVKASDRPQVKCSRDAYKIFMENWNPDIIEFVEEFKILLMNRSNSVLGILEISKGGISGTVTDVRVIFQAAIKGNASGIIVHITTHQVTLTPVNLIPGLHRRSKKLVT